MQEKKVERKEVPHTIYTAKRTFGQKAADGLAQWAGSWGFIFLFLIIVAIWIVANIYFFVQYNLGKPWDPYPFILLNLVLSLLAALQAPVILMSQNRQTERDRIRTEYDYSVNRKAEREIRELRKLVERLHKIRV